MPDTPAELTIRSGVPACGPGAAFAQAARPEAAAHAASVSRLAREHLTALAEQVLARKTTPALLAA